MGSEMCIRDSAHSVLTAFHRGPHRDHAGGGTGAGAGTGGGVGNESSWSLECCRSTSNHHHSCLARTQTSTRFSSTENQTCHADCSTAASVTASRRDVTASTASQHLMPVCDSDVADRRSVDSVVMPVVYDGRLMMKLLLLLLRALHVITTDVTHQREHHSPSSTTRPLSLSLSLSVCVCVVSHSMAVNCTAVHGGRLLHAPAERGKTPA